MTKRIWRITGRAGLKVIFECDVPFHHLSERQVIEMLARLAAKQLTDREIVSSSLGGRAKSRMHHLEITKDTTRYSYFTAGDPHYVASAEEVP